MNKKLQELIEKINANPPPVDSSIGDPGCEEAFWREIRNVGGGCIAFHGGWPDFGVYGKNKCLKAVVETKSETEEWVQEHQLTRLIGLAKLGVPSFMRCGSFLIHIDENGKAQQVEMDALTHLL